MRNDGNLRFQILFYDNRVTCVCDIHGSGPTEPFVRVCCLLVRYIYKSGSDQSVVRTPFRTRRVESRAKKPMIKYRWRKGR